MDTEPKRELDLNDLQVISNIFSVYISFARDKSRLADIELLKAYGYYEFALRHKLSKTETGKLDAHNEILGPKLVLTRQPMHHDSLPIMNGLSPSNSPLAQRKKKKTDKVEKVPETMMFADNADAKGLNVAFLFPHEMRGQRVGNRKKTKVLRPADWAMRGIKHHWIPMLDNTYEMQPHLIEDAIFLTTDFFLLESIINIHCKSGVGRSGTFMVLLVAYLYLLSLEPVTNEALKPVIDAIQKYAPEINNTLNAHPTNRRYPLRQLLEAARKHVFNQRPQLDVGEERMKVALNLLLGLETHIQNGTNAISHRPPNYRFIFRLVQSNAFKTLIMDFASYNMQHTQRAKDVQPFLARLLRNEPDWYTELFRVAHGEKSSEHGTLGHYINSHPKTEKRTQHEKNNSRRQSLLESLHLQILALANSDDLSDSAYVQQIKMERAKLCNIPSVPLPTPQTQPIPIDGTALPTEVPEYPANTAWSPRFSASEPTPITNSSSSEDKTPISHSAPEDTSYLLEPDESPSSGNPPIYGSNGSPWE